MKSLEQLRLNSPYKTIERTPSILFQALIACGIDKQVVHDSLKAISKKWYVTTKDYLE